MRVDCRARTKTKRKRTADSLLRGSEGERRLENGEILFLAFSSFPFLLCVCCPSAAFQVSCRVSPIIEVETTEITFLCPSPSGLEVSTIPCCQSKILFHLISVLLPPLRLPLLASRRAGMKGKELQSAPTFFPRPPFLGENWDTTKGQLCQTVEKRKEGRKEGRRGEGRELWEITG